MNYRDLELKAATRDPGIQSGCLLLAVLVAILGLVLIYLFSVVLAPPAAHQDLTPAQILQDTDDADDSDLTDDEPDCTVKILDLLKKITL